MRHIECDAFWLLSHFLMPFTSNSVIGVFVRHFVKVLRICWFDFLFCLAIDPHIACELSVWFLSLLLSFVFLSLSFSVICGLLMRSLNLNAWTFLIECHTTLHTARRFIYRHLYHTIRGVFGQDHRQCQIPWKLRFVREIMEKASLVSRSSMYISI